MSPAVYAAWLGLARGWTEFRQSLTSVADLSGNVFVAVAIVIVLYFQRNSTVRGRTFRSPSRCCRASSACGSPSADSRVRQEH